MNEKKYKYRFTLFTPCYCSAKFIDRIKETIDGQTFRDFEWIVVNDASTDNTSELLQEYIKTLDVPVKFFDLKHNQMLAANSNLAVENAEGEIIIGLGHDDIYLPNMLELFNDLYNKYNSDKIGGIIARCQTQYGRITPIAFSKNIMSYWEYGVDKNGRYTGEAPCAWKTDVLRKYMPFDTKELLPPLVGALMSCDGYEFITTNEIVRKYYVYEKGGHSLSKFSKKYAWHSYRGALRRINLFAPHYHMCFSVKQKISLDYATAAIRSNISFVEAIRVVDRFKPLIIMSYPLAYIRVFAASIDPVFRVYKTLRNAIMKKKH